MFALAPSTAETSKWSLRSKKSEWNIKPTRKYLILNTQINTNGIQWSVAIWGRYTVAPAFAGGGNVLSIQWLETGEYTKAKGIGRLGSQQNKKNEAQQHGTFDVRKQFRREHHVTCNTNNRQDGRYMRQPRPLRTRKSKQATSGFHVRKQLERWCQRISK